MSFTVTRRPYPRSVLSKLLDGDTPAKPEPPQPVAKKKPAKKAAKKRAAKKGGKK
jgi:hypothetical protein